MAYFMISKQLVDDLKITPSVQNFQEGLRLPHRIIEFSFIPYREVFQVQIELADMDKDQEVELIYQKDDQANWSLKEIKKVG